MMENEIQKICREVAEAMCDKYCKYPNEYSRDDYEKMLDEVCADCPLNRIN